MAEGLSADEWLLCRLPKLESYLSHLPGAEVCGTASCTHNKGGLGDGTTQGRRQPPRLPAGKKIPPVLILGAYVLECWPVHDQTNTDPKFAALLSPNRPHRLSQANWRQVLHGRSHTSDETAVLLGPLGDTFVARDALPVLCEPAANGVRAVSQRLPDGAHGEEHHPITLPRVHGHVQQAHPGAHFGSLGELRLLAEHDRHVGAQLGEARLHLLGFQALLKPLQVRPLQLLRDDVHLLGQGHDGASVRAVPYGDGDGARRVAGLLALACLPLSEHLDVQVHEGAVAHLGQPPVALPPRNAPGRDLGPRPLAQRLQVLLVLLVERVLVHAALVRLVGAALPAEQQKPEATCSQVCSVRPLSVAS
eukprot:scaffold347_cov380-Prasinococcus_capsulatus_cf.AAC.32